MIELIKQFINSSYLFPALLLVAPVIWILLNNSSNTSTPSQLQSTPKTETKAATDVKSSSSKETKGISPGSLFGAETTENKIPKPLTTSYTEEELSKYDGSDPDSPVYLAIKGQIFDVTSNRDTYGPGGSYSMFSGKDGSRALAISSLKAKDCISDISDLGEDKMKVLNDWFAFFERKYPIIGIVKRD